jgi:predicted CopG family antitoxin
MDLLRKLIKLRKKELFELHNSPRHVTADHEMLNMMQERKSTLRILRRILGWTLEGRGKIIFKLILGK